jgi:hypothetical protein
MAVAGGRVRRSPLAAFSILPTGTDQGLGVRRGSGTGWLAATLGQRVTTRW